MRELRARLWLPLLSLALLAAAIVVLVRAIPSPPKAIRIATAFKGGAYEHFGQRYQTLLGRSGIKVELLPSNGSLDNLRLLQDRSKGVQVAFVQGGVSGGAVAPGLVSLGRINHQILWVFHRHSLHPKRLSELKSQRIAIGPVGSGTRVLAEQVLSLHGVRDGETQFLPLAGEAAAQALLQGRVDVVFLAFAADAPVVQQLLHEPRVRLMSIEQAEAIARRLPFLNHLSLPQGVIDLERDLPPQDVQLLATTNALLVREDLHPDMIQLLARMLEEEHGQPGLFQRAGEFPTSTDPEYPMAEAARRYYRNGPSYLQRVLPYGYTAHLERAAALLMAGAALFFPLFNYLPRLYRWMLRERRRHLYRQLRDIEAQLHSPLEAALRDTLEQELDALERASRRLSVPLRHSDLFFELKNDIHLVRMRLRDLPLIPIAESP